MNVDILGRCLVCGFDVPTSGICNNCHTFAPRNNTPTVVRMDALTGTATTSQPAPASAPEPEGGFWSAGDPQYIALLGLRAMKGITDARAADCHRKASHSQEFSGGIGPMLARAYELDRQSSHLAVAIDAIEQNRTLRARVAELERVTEAFTDEQIDAGIRAVEALRIMRKVWTPEEKRDAFLRAVRGGG